MGEGGIRSKSRVPRNEEEEERAGGQRGKKAQEEGGKPRAVKGEKRRQATHIYIYINIYVWLGQEQLQAESCH